MYFELCGNNYGTFTFKKNMYDICFILGTDGHETNYINASLYKLAILILVNFWPLNRNVM